MTNLSTTTIERSALWQLKALLAMATSSGRHSNFFPAGIRHSGELARHLNALCKESAQAGDALLSAICTRQTPLPALLGIKDLAKSLAANASAETERAAATLLYHAAVAAALGGHAQNISTRSASARFELYEDLAACLAGDPLGKVFQEAADILMSESPPSGKQT